LIDDSSVDAGATRSGRPSSNAIRPNTSRTMAKRSSGVVDEPVCGILAGSVTAVGLVVVGPPACATVVVEAVVLEPATVVVGLTVVVVEEVVLLELDVELVLDELLLVLRLLDDVGGVAATVQLNVELAGVTEFFATLVTVILASQYLPVSMVLFWVQM